MSAEDEWSRNTAYVLEAATPQTTVTTTWGMYGGEAQLSTVSSTLAPNVGPPRSAPVDRRDTGYVSMAQNV